MKIAPVNNIGFGKLVISRDKDTVDSLRKLTSNNVSFEIFDDVFEKIDNESGTRKVVLTARANSHRRGRGYTLSLNEHIKGWRGKATVTMYEGDSGDIRRSQLDKLAEECEKQIEYEKNIPSSRDFDALLDKYDGFEPDYLMEIACANAGLPL